MVGAREELHKKRSVRAQLPFFITIPRTHFFYMSVQIKRSIRLLAKNYKRDVISVRYGTELDIQKAYWRHLQLLHTISSAMSHEN